MVADCIRRHSISDSRRTCSLFIVNDWNIVSNKQSMAWITKTNTAMVINCDFVISIISVFNIIPNSFI